MTYKQSESGDFSKKHLTVKETNSKEATQSMMVNRISNQERQEKIGDLVLQNQRVTIQEICDIFHISEATARRDLDLLKDLGKLRRVHGGGISAPPNTQELPLQQRQQVQREEKERIAQAAADMVHDGDSIYLGSGTTILELAKRLRERQNLLVFTNSLLVVNAMAGFTGVNLIILGGEHRASESSFIGHYTEIILKEIHADKVFIGVFAISPEDGVTHQFLPETQTDRAILNCGRERIILADRTKFGRKAPFSLAMIDQFETIITDKGLAPQTLAALKEKGIKVITV